MAAARAAALDRAGRRPRSASPASPSAARRSVALIVARRLVIVLPLAGVPVALVGPARADRGDRQTIGDGLTGAAGRARSVPGHQRVGPRGDRARRRRAAARRGAPRGIRAAVTGRSAPGRGGAAADRAGGRPVDARAAPEFRICRAWCCSACWRRSCGASGSAATAASAAAPSPCCWRDRGGAGRGPRARPAQAVAQLPGAGRIDRQRRHVDTFNWNQTYGPLHWPHSGHEVLTVEAAHGRLLEGRGPRCVRRHALGARRRGRRADAASAPDRGRRCRWTQTLRVTVTGMSTNDVIAAGMCAAADAGPGRGGAGVERRDVGRRAGRSDPASSYRVTASTPRSPSRRAASHRRPLPTRARRCERPDPDDPADGRPAAGVHPGHVRPVFPARSARSAPAVSYGPTSNIRP